MVDVAESAGPRSLSRGPIPGLLVPSTPQRKPLQVAIGTATQHQPTRFEGRRRRGAAIATGQLPEKYQGLPTVLAFPMPPDLRNGSDVSVLGLALSRLAPVAEGESP